MKFLSSSLVLRAACVAGVLVIPAVNALAEEGALIDGGGVAITARDLRADAQRMPPQMRDQVLIHADQVTQIASNLYARRTLAQQAVAQGLADRDDVKAELQVARDKVLSDALLAKIDKENTPDDAKLEKLALASYTANPDKYKTPEKVQVRHILIAGLTDADKTKAEQVLAKLKGGADFAALAKEYSADTGSAAKGGELGFFSAADMVPEFTQAAFAMKKPGELSDVVKTKFGFHILQFEGRKPAGIRPFEEVKTELIQSTRNTILQEGRMPVVQKIQESASIHKDAIDKFAASYKSEH